MELFGANWRIWSYLELFGAIWNYLELFGAIWNFSYFFYFLTFPSFPTLNTFHIFPTFLTFPIFPTFPTFPTFSFFPTFLVWTAQGISENISRLGVRDIKSPPSFSLPSAPHWAPLYKSLGGYGIGGLGYSPRITNVILNVNNLQKYLTL